VKKIISINFSGGPIIRDDELFFTEGGLVHILFALANLASDYDITILCPNPPGSEEKHITRYKGINIICVGSSRWVRWMGSANLSFLREVKSYVERERPDILIGNGVAASSLLRFAPKGTLKIGVIHHLYHASSVDASSQYAVRGVGVLERLGLHLMRLDKVAVINPMVKDVLVREGFPPDKIVVVGNGVDIEEYSFSENKVPYSLIYIGRLTELKRVSSLIEVVLMVKKEIPGVVLHIAGDGPQREKIRRQIETLGVAPNIVIHGYLSETKKIELLSSCAIYVSNSIFEGFGIPVVEAMATGAVPVVNDIAAHRFIFQGKPVGYLVRNEEEMAARIIDLLGDEPERLRLARNGRRLVEEKWTWPRVGEKYRQLIEK
jgi:glycosyltransferase involved in cell wall biosynthesis